MANTVSWPSTPAVASKIVTDNKRAPKTPKEAKGNAEEPTPRRRESQRISDGLEEPLRKTTEIDVFALVKEHCLSCEHVIVPPDAVDELDMYRCAAAGDRHCLVAVTTTLCVKKPLSKSSDNKRG
jgi:hypothetical protein